MMKFDRAYAFPFTIPADNGQGQINYFGMSLRDYFAAAAVGGMFAADTKESVIKTELKAKLAYEVADAMLAERDK